MVPVGLELARCDMMGYGTDWGRFLVSEHVVTVGLSMIAIPKKPSVIEPRGFGGGGGGLGLGTVS